MNKQVSRFFKEASEILRPSSNDDPMQVSETVAFAHLHHVRHMQRSTKELGLSTELALLRRDFTNHWVNEVC